jgi:NADH-quinone oxidoreductase subunit N
LPEIILILVATAIYVGGAFAASRDAWTWLAAAGLLLAALALHQQQDVLESYAAPVASQPDAQSAPGAEAHAPTVEALASGPILVDLFTQTIRWFVIGVGLLFVLLTARPASQTLAPEFVGSLLLILAGLMVIALSNDLVLMFLGLELVSIPTYVVLCLGNNDRSNQESATKYFFLSILSSGLLLYGFSFLYGVARSTNLLDIHEALGDAVPQAQGIVTFSRLGLLLVFAGLGFRLTAVPFHFYAPDVYQGTSHANAAILSVVPKIAGLVALVRVAAAPMVGEGSYLEVASKIGWQLSLVLAVLTMTVGNLLALWQNNLRRLLAYSSVAHAGYMLVGVAVAFAVGGGAQAGAAAHGFAGIGATVFYLLTYSLATIGVFAALAWLSGDLKSVNTVDELAGVARKHPLVAAAVAVCMFSLTGLPGFAGFWGKLILLNGALSVGSDGPMRAWFVGLAVLVAINAAISAGYYLRIVAAMYFREALHTAPAEGGPGAGAALVICALGVVGIFIFPTQLVESSQRAAQAAQVSIVQHATELNARVDAPTAVVAATAATATDVAEADRPTATQIESTSDK